MAGEPPPYQSINYAFYWFDGIDSHGVPQHFEYTTTRGATVYKPELVDPFHLSPDSERITRFLPPLTPGDENAIRQPSWAGSDVDMSMQGTDEEALSSELSIDHDLPQHTTSERDVSVTPASCNDVDLQDITMAEDDDLPEPSATRGELDQLPQSDAISERDVHVSFDSDPPIVLDHSALRSRYGEKAYQRFLQQRTATDEHPRVPYWKITRDKPHRKYLRTLDPTTPSNTQRAKNRLASGSKQVSNKMIGMTTRSAARVAAELEYIPGPSSDGVDDLHDDDAKFEDGSAQEGSRVAEELDNDEENGHGDEGDAQSARDGDDSDEDDTSLSIVQLGNEDDQLFIDQMESWDDTDVEEWFAATSRTSREDFLVAEAEFEHQTGGTIGAKEDATSGPSKLKISNRRGKQPATKTRLDEKDIRWYDENPISYESLIPHFLEDLRTHGLDEEDLRKVEHFVTNLEFTPLQQHPHPSQSTTESTTPQTSWLPSGSAALDLRWEEFVDAHNALVSSESHERDVDVPFAGPRLERDVHAPFAASRDDDFLVKPSGNPDLAKMCVVWHYPPLRAADEHFGITADPKNACMISFAKKLGILPTALADDLFMIERFYGRVKTPGGQSNGKIRPYDGIYSASALQLHQDFRNANIASCSASVVVLLGTQNTEFIATQSMRHDSITTAALSSDRLFKDHSWHVAIAWDRKSTDTRRQVKRLYFLAQHPEASFYSGNPVISELNDMVINYASMLSGNHTVNTRFFAIRSARIRGEMCEKIDDWIQSISDRARITSDDVRYLRGFEIMSKTIISLARLPPPLVAEIEVYRKHYANLIQYEQSPSPTSYCLSMRHHLRDRDPHGGRGKTQKLACPVPGCRNGQRVMMQHLRGLHKIALPLGKRGNFHGPANLQLWDTAFRKWLGDMGCPTNNGYFVEKDGDELGTPRYKGVRDKYALGNATKSYKQVSKAGQKSRAATKFTHVGLKMLGPRPSLDVHANKSKKFMPHFCPVPHCINSLSTSLTWSDLRAHLKVTHGFRTRSTGIDKNMTVEQVRDLNDANWRQFLKDKKVPYNNGFFKRKSGDSDHGVEFWDYLMNGRYGPDAFKCPVLGCYDSIESTRTEVTTHLISGHGIPLIKLKQCQIEVMSTPTLKKHLAANDVNFREWLEKHGHPYNDYFATRFE
ncbi:hypothetical protein LTR86_000812 [Recurvomyces mirabilis]|nr:hypothetical protein LTR86_000812 [Recurvomyces mirabilis]